MSRGASARDLEAVFERSLALLERLLPRIAPRDSPADIIQKARVIIEGLGEDERIAILDEHPRIGADPATLSALSRREQADTTDEATLRELVDLNARYERAFGFRFVVFVNGRAKAQILPVLRERMTRSRDAELRTGIEEFLAISLDRLRKAADRDTRNATDDGW